MEIPSQGDVPWWIYLLATALGLLLLILIIFLLRCFGFFRRRRRGNDDGDDDDDYDERNAKKGHDIDGVLDKEERERMMMRVNTIKTRDEG